MKLRLATGVTTVLLAAALSPLISPPPAQASTPAAVVTMEDFVLWDGCNRYPYTYSIDPAGYSSWSMTTFHEPGEPFLDGYLRSDEQPPTGTDYFQFCEHLHSPGVHTVLGKLNVGPGPLFVTTPDSFTIRRPATQTRIEVSDETPRPGQQVEVRLVTMVESPSGFVRDDSSVLQLQQKTKKGWKKVARQKTDKGKAKTGFRYRGGKVTLRGRSIGSAGDNDTGSFSVKVTFG